MLKKPEYRSVKASSKQCSRCGVTKQLVTDKTMRRHCDVGCKCIMRKIRKMLIRVMVHCPSINELAARQDAQTEDTFAEISSYFFFNEVEIDQDVLSFDQSEAMLLMEAFLDTSTPEAHCNFIEMLRR